MKIVFSDHGFHARTHSSDFFLELLQGKGEIATVFNDNWKDGLDTPLDIAPVQAENPDIIIFFQQLPDPGEIEQLGCRCVLVPMCDECDFDVAQWRAYCQPGVRVLCFDSVTFSRVQAAGCNCLNARYFPQPEIARATEGLQVFYWQRRLTIHWAMVRRLLGDARINRVVIKRDPDPAPYFQRDPWPGEANWVPSQEDLADYNIEFLDGWLERGEYLAALESCSVFISPRPSEGIGMASLEAMARGLCVCNADQGCTREYIEHGVNGYLYDLDVPSAIDFSDYHSVGQNAIESTRRGAMRWSSEKKDVQAFIFEW